MTNKESGCEKMAFNFLMEECSSKQWEHFVGVLFSILWQT